MSWRTVVISSHCKLDLKMGCMVIRSEDTKRILLDEVSVIIIENNAVAITGCLINELARRKIAVIFCDEKHNPFSELMPLYGAHDCASKVRAQIAWSNDIKTAVWTEIVAEKIHQQSEHLRNIGCNQEADKLAEYITEMELGDASNKEGHAAKVYFHALYGVNFSRSYDNATNSALNYGYSLILSAVNREICACGYITQLGLFHENMFNEFNLGCDLMEPFRVLVDRMVFSRKYSVFGSEQKHDMVLLLSKTVMINGAEQYLPNAIRIYVRSVFDALNSEDISKICFYSNIEESK